MSEAYQADGSYSYQCTNPDCYFCYYFKPVTVPVKVNRKLIPVKIQGPGKHYSKYELHYLQSNYPDKNVYHIARHLNRTSHAITLKLIEMGLYIRKGPTNAGLMAIWEKNKHSG